jgi:hypothetical protein
MIENLVARLRVKAWTEKDIRRKNHLLDLAAELERGQDAEAQVNSRNVLYWGINGKTEVKP